MNLTIPLGPFYVWVMVFLRTAFVLGFFPLIGERFVPLRIRILMSAALSLALAPVVPVTAAMFPSTMGGMVMLVASEALLGMGVGFIGRIVFGIIQFSGQIAGEQMGFGLINAIDPTGSHQISVVAEMQYVLAILIFLLADMHHVFLKVIVDSYAIAGPGMARPSAAATGFFMQLGALMFELAIQFAMPVVIMIFAINIALGMIARAVPQINVFMESFPLRIIAGVSILMLSIGFTVGLWSNLFERMNGMMIRLTGLMR